MSSAPHHKADRKEAANICCLALTFTGMGPSFTVILRDYIINLAHKDSGAVNLS